MRKVINQIIKFGFVGILCFFIDYFLMIVLTELFQIKYIISSGISFTLSVTVNYILSMRFVFQSKKGINKTKEFLIFLILSVIGLGLNQLLMWVIVEKIHIFYMLTKIFVTGVVMVYNFVTRKIFLEEKNDN